MNRDGFDVNDSPASTSSNTSSGRRMIPASSTTSSKSNDVASVAEELRLLRQQRDDLEMQIQRKRFPTIHPPRQPFYSSSLQFLGGSTTQRASQLTAGVLSGSLNPPSFVANPPRFGSFMQRATTGLGSGGTSYYRQFYRPASFCWYLETTNLPNVAANPAKLSSSPRPIPPRSPLEEDEMKTAAIEDLKPSSKPSRFPLPTLKEDAPKIPAPKLGSFRKLWSKNMEQGEQEDSSFLMQHRRETFQTRLRTGQVNIDRDESITGRYQRRQEQHERRKRQRVKGVNEVVWKRRCL